MYSLSIYRALSLAKNLLGVLLQPKTTPSTLQSCVTTQYCIAPPPINSMHGHMEKQETDIENGKRPLPVHIYKQDVHLSVHLYLALSLAS